jgi:hypothetical protein
MASYVMRTLPDLEIEPLEVHLFLCKDCRVRLVAMLGAAGKLPQTDPAHYVVSHNGQV